MLHPAMKKDTFDIKSSLKAFINRRDILLERLAKRMDYLEGRAYLLDYWEEFFRDYDIASGVRARTINMAKQGR